MMRKNARAGGPRPHDQRKAVGQVAVRAAVELDPLAVCPGDDPEAVCLISCSQSAAYARRCAEHDRPDLGGRCSHDAPPGLCDQPAEAQAYRGAVRLGQDYRRACPAHAARSRTLEIQVHSDDGRLRDPVAQLAQLARMTSRRLSKMDSTPTKLPIMNSLSPWRTAGHHTPSARISVAC